MQLRGLFLSFIRQLPHVIFVLLKLFKQIKFN